MNISGTYKGVNWIGLVRQRAGGRKLFTLKYSTISGELRARSAPEEVTDETQFRTWVAKVLDLVLEVGDQETTTGDSDAADDVLT